MRRQLEDRGVAFGARSARSRDAARQCRCLLQEVPPTFARASDAPDRCHAARFFGAGGISLSSCLRIGRRSSMVLAMRLHTERHNSTMVWSATL